MGFEPMTSAIPVQCSTNWAIKPTGSWSFSEFYIYPLRWWDDSEYMKIHTFELQKKEWLSEWSSQLYMQLKQLRKESPKKIQAWIGFEPMTSAILVQCSTNWAIKSLIEGLKCYKLLTPPLCLHQVTKRRMCISCFTAINYVLEKPTCSLFSGRCLLFILRAMQDCCHCCYSKRSFLISVRICVCGISFFVVLRNFNLYLTFYCVFWGNTCMMAVRESQRGFS